MEFTNRIQIKNSALCRKKIIRKITGGKRELSNMFEYGEIQPRKDKRAEEKTKQDNQKECSEGQKRPH